MFELLWTRRSGVWQEKMKEGITRDNPRYTLEMWWSKNDADILEEDGISLNFLLQETIKTNPELRKSLIMQETMKFLKTVDPKT